MKNLAIIPARSGSKGLPDKNIKILNGKPLIAYTIEAAIQSRLFDDIIVSTDSKEYAEIAKKNGASVPFLREAELSTDTAKSWDVVKEVLHQCAQLDKKYDTVALLQPTSPLRDASDIKQAYKKMRREEANLVVSVCETDHSPLWSNTLTEDHSLVDFLKPEYTTKTRQEIPTYYRLNGAIYIVKTDYLFETENIYASKSYATIMDKVHSVDIDDEIDFLVAEALLKQRAM